MMNTATLDPVSVTLPQEESSQSTFAQKLFLSDPVSVYREGAIMNQLVGFAQIKDNWDGNGAYAPSMAAILNVVFLTQLLPYRAVSLLEEDDVYLSFHGTIIIDLEKNNKLLSIEMGDDSLGYFLEENEEIVETSVETRDIEPFSRLSLSSGLAQATEWLLI